MNRLLLSNSLRRQLTTTAVGASCTATPPPNLPPVVWTYLPSNLPYALGLLLQETLVARRHSARKLLSSPASASLPASTLAAAKKTADTDILLLLQHTPVYTAGRREKDQEQLERERKRLKEFGADHVATMRGGETTYHGPGQLVGYSLMDIQRCHLSTRCYVSHLETFLANLTTSLSVPVHPISHTGVFVSPTLKIGSIGIHIRRYITLHGFSLNIESQTLPWFGNIVACGLDDVSATSVEKETGKEIKVQDVLDRVVNGFGNQYGREMKELGEEDEELREVIKKGVEGKLDEIKGL